MRPSPARLLNILVPVKRAVDYSVKIRVNAAQTGIDTNVKHSMNPFDEIAIEEAIRIREKHAASKLVKNITAITVGGPKSVETLRTALALGADAGVHVQPEGEEFLSPEPLTIAKALHAHILSLPAASRPSMVILGKQAIDDDSGVTGQMLAGLLGWGQATFASEVTLENVEGEGESEKGEVKVTREIDGGGEEVRCRLPLVVTTDLRLNEPRYASLPNIMKAKKKPISVVPLNTLLPNAADREAKLEVLKVEEPPARKGGGKVGSVSELVERLKAAGVV